MPIWLNTISNQKWEAEKAQDFLQSNWHVFAEPDKSFGENWLSVTQDQHEKSSTYQTGIQIKEMVNDVKEQGIIEGSLDFTSSAFY